MKGSSKLTSGKGAGFLPPGGYKPKSGVIDYKDPNTVKTIVSKDPLTGAGDRGSAFPRVGDNKRKSPVPVGPTKAAKKK